VKLLNWNHSKLETGWFMSIVKGEHCVRLGYYRKAQLQKCTIVNLMLNMKIKTTIFRMDLLNTGATCDNV